jgi:peptide-methionine (S)-S-oxide reductase
MAEYGWLKIAPHAVAQPKLAEPSLGSPARIILAGGCFWCTEAVIKPLAGILSVRSGYAGGTADTANYQAVCSGRTGHAEAIEVTFDPSLISYSAILQVFFTVAHDPTTKNRQGNDVGPQYRSAIFYSSEAERLFLQDFIATLNKAHQFVDTIVTTLEPLDVFYVAEDYHQDYARRNPLQPYVMFAASPKLSKLKTEFDALLAEERNGVH